MIQKNNLSKKLVHSIVIVGATPSKSMSVAFQQTTGIPGLDKIFNGNISKYNLTFLVGTSSAGKKRDSRW